MLAEASGRSNPRWIDRVRVLVQQWRDEVEEMLELNTGPIRPERIVSEIGSALPTDGAVVVDTLQASVWSGSFMPLKGATPALHPLRRLAGLGVSGGDRREVRARQPTGVCFTGDGGFYYHLAELETAARYEIPVVVVVNNNGAYGADRRSEPNPYRRDESREADRSWKFGQHNFAQIARELGCEGVRVERPTDLGAALQNALASGKPVVLDVLTDPPPATRAPGRRPRWPTSETACVSAGARPSSSDADRGLVGYPARVKVAAVETIQCAETYPPFIFVRVHTDAGLVGLGQTADTRTAPFVHDLAERFLLGRDPLEIDAFWSTAFDFAAYHGYPGAELRAVSALDIALCQLVVHLLDRVRVVVDALVGTVTEGVEHHPPRFGVRMDEVDDCLHRHAAPLGDPDHPWMQKC